MLNTIRLTTLFALIFVGCEDNPLSDDPLNSLTDVGVEETTDSTTAMEGDVDASERQADGDADAADYTDAGDGADSATESADAGGTGGPSDGGDSADRSDSGDLIAEPDSGDSPDQPDASDPADAPDAGGMVEQRSPLQRGLTEYRWRQLVDGRPVERLFRIHAPRNIDPRRRYPVIFFLHGSGGTGQNYERQHNQAVNNGRFVGVYPDGHNRGWNMTGDGRTTADDVAFITEIIEQLDGLQNIDPERRFVLGSSNGGGMAQKLAVETTHFKAITALVTQLYIGNEPNERTPNISVLQILGMLDETIPYEGGRGPGPTLRLYPAEESAAMWAEHNGCEAPVVDDNEERILITYGACDDEVRVVHYGVKQSGHRLPRRLDDLGISEIAFRFFESTP